MGTIPLFRRKVVSLIKYRDAETLEMREYNKSNNFFVLIKVLIKADKWIFDNEESKGKMSVTCFLLPYLQLTRYSSVDLTKNIQRV